MPSLHHSGVYLDNVLVQGSDTSCGGQQNRAGDRSWFASRFFSLPDSEAFSVRPGSVDQSSDGKVKVTVRVGLPRGCVLGSSSNFQTWGFVTLR